MEVRDSARTVLITGGSSGIGAAAVRAFAERGDQVWFTYHRGARRAGELVRELALAEGGRPHALPFDQGDWDSLKELLKALPQTVDVLVNNAALGTATVEQAGATSRHMEDELFTRVNCLGPLWLTRHLLPGMVKRGYGKILTVSSVGGGIAAFPGFRDADGMSKAAVAFLTRQWAAELSHEPVEVFCVCPGAVDSPMFRQSTLDPLSPADAAELVTRLPRGRLIRAEEIAEVLWWLTTAAAVPLHGAVIDASMGLGVRPGLITNR
ncbi:SDR family NAD(P)-dependent oxidoreductase [Streptomyces clavuligerus]|uniref:SDR family NAD(P)-dependent oxidoreductase n=1 Tax=Streptomyces clavuligerus TaxID=1901 RepID=UPI00020D90B0|nr:SDR family oxidoreductase [Streptomyces clavuligerus]WDN57370.1 SDR family oxidoreductase [Streptomyces clavuligerus]